MNTVRTFLVAAALLAIEPANAEEIAGRAGVIDGDPIELHGKRIRLWAIDAPESDQLCRNDDSQSHPQVLRRREYVLCGPDRARRNGRRASALIDKVWRHCETTGTEGEQ